MSARGGPAAGFSLVETLVAIAILSGVLIATYTSLSSALAAAQRIAIRKDAVETVLQRFADARLRGIRSPQAAGGETASYRWSLAITVLPLAAASGRNAVIPYRAVGTIQAKGSAGPAHVVLDTILLGRGT